MELQFISALPKNPGIKQDMKKLSPLFEKTCLITPETTLDTTIPTLVMRYSLPNLAKLLHATPTPRMPSPIILFRYIADQTTLDGVLAQQLPAKWLRHVHHTSTPDDAREIMRKYPIALYATKRL